MSELLAALLPRNARRVLVAGSCGTEAVAAARSAGATEVWQISVGPEAHRIELTSPDRHLIGTILHFKSSIPAASFDVALIGRLLETSLEPLQELQQIHQWLVTDGVLIGQITNARCHEVLDSLISGNLTYGAGGLLANEQMRLYTLRELERIAYRAGYELDLLHGVGSRSYDAWQTVGRPNLIRFGSHEIRDLPTEEMVDLYTSKYLFRAVRQPPAEHALTSIIIVTHNEWSYTELCLASIRDRTDEPYELILVDNGSSDATVDQLRRAPDVRLIENADNRGFPAAVNQGLVAANGQAVVLLNNDCVVTTGWLRRIRDAFRSDPQVGLVGPVTNFTAGPQKIAVDYQHLADLDGFAWNLGKRLAGTRLECELLFGFCLAIRREVVDQVGLLDEGFGIGVCEDDDYCLRAQQAGFRLVIAADCFVHHFGSRTFTAKGIDLNEQLAVNQARLKRKWSLDAAPTDSDEPPAP